MERRKNIFEESRKYQLGSDGNVASMVPSSKSRNPQKAKPLIDPNRNINRKNFTTQTASNSMMLDRELVQQQEMKTEITDPLQTKFSNQQYVKPLQVASGRERRLRNNISNNPYFNKMNPSMNSGFVEQEGQERNSIYGSNPYFNSFV
tara:strand:- start:4612 stop:5055 length:444 start_codon:yes stop_codon:yes gene_type:complete